MKSSLAATIAQPRRAPLRPRYTADLPRAGAHMNHIFPPSRHPERRLANRRCMLRGGRRQSDVVTFNEWACTTDATLARLGPESAPLALVVDDFSDGREMLCEYLRY